MLRRRWRRRSNGVGFSDGHAGYYGCCKVVFAVAPGSRKALALSPEPGRARPLQVTDDNGGDSDTEFTEMADNTNDEAAGNTVSYFTVRYSTQELRG